MNLIEERDFDCPYCGEYMSVSVDCSAGSHDFIEDCAVCCRPIELHAEVDNGLISSLTARRDDE